MLKIVIIDDDNIAITHLTGLLSNLISFDIHIVGKASNLEEGIELIKKTQPDIVFLDINLPGKKGLEIFKEFKEPKFKIIFCTAFEQYAIDVVKIGCCGYLSKPVDLIDLRELLQKVSTELKSEQIHHQQEDKINYQNTPDMPGENILLITETGFIMLNTRNIEYCYASGAYSIIVKNGGKEILVTKPLKELQGLLPENQFYRTHKSYLINIYYLRSYVHAKESYVLLRSGIRIPVSVRISSVITKDINRLMNL